MASVMAASMGLVTCKSACVTTRMATCMSTYIATTIAIRATMTELVAICAWAWTYAWQQKHGKIGLAKVSFMVATFMGMEPRKATLLVYTHGNMRHGDGNSRGIAHAHGNIHGT